MRNFEVTEFDFNFEEGIKSEGTKNLRNGDTYLPITGMQPTRRTDVVEQVFTSEREARVIAHQKRIQKGLRKGKRYEDKT